MIKTASIIFILLYMFGVTRIGLIYSTHELFHHSDEENHTTEHTSENECEHDCLIIKVVENSENSTETKIFKISTENISSHITYSFILFSPTHNEVIFNKEISYPQKEPSGTLTPPPRS